MNNRVVIDTNVLISAILFPRSQIAKAVEKAMVYYELYASDETISEFLEVIQRDKFNKYFTNRSTDKQVFINTFIHSVTRIEPTIKVTDCSDPKDNKFLEVALSANAALLLTGDKRDLITMNPYCGLEIITVSEFLQRTPITTHT